MVIRNTLPNCNNKLLQTSVIQPSTKMRELKGTTHERFRLGDEQWETKSIEQENVSIVEALYRAIEKGDLSSFKDQLDETIRLDIVGPDSVPFTGSAAGIGPVVEFAMNNFSQLEEQNAQINELIAQGTSVVVFGEETGKFKGHEKSYQMEWVQHFKVINKKIVSIRQVFDTASIAN